MRKKLIVDGLLEVEKGINAAAMVEEEVLTFLLKTKLVDEINIDESGEGHIILSPMGEDFLIRYA